MTDSPTELTFGCIPAAGLEVVWGDVRKLLEPAVKTAAGKLDIDDVRKDIESGTLVLWLVVDGTTPIAAITTRIVAYPQRRALAMDWIGGRRMKEWLPIAQRTLSKFAVDNGCAHLEGYGRRAWGKWLSTYGWAPDYITYKMELGDGKR